ncbi:MAG: PadR family transcriptional regulator [Candidatus Aenigmatarchaeota archaeon]|nr:MAG: PadR family transcriptional regulator [Candidatus Aenigmarchaeota archaeon]
MQAWERLVRNSTLECLWPYVLSILKTRPMHAYLLRNEIEKRFGFRPGRVTAYKVLYKLKREGLVRAKRAGRKEVYSLTPQGLKELERAKKYWAGLARKL